MEVDYNVTDTEINCSINKRRRCSRYECGCRAVVRAGINKGMKVYGVYRGYNGLLNGDVEEMNLEVYPISSVTAVQCFTQQEAKSTLLPAGIQRVADFCRSIGVSGVVVIGGDGSFRGARCLTNAGINCIGVPGTIDNDIACSEYTVGFDTAMNTAIRMVDRIRDTAQSHDRCSVVEVMGRRCGDIALQTGIATGATAILVPEVQYNIERDVIARIINTRENRQKTLYRCCCRGCRRCKRSCKVCRTASWYRGKSYSPRSCTAWRFSDTS